MSATCFFDSSMAGVGGRVIKNIYGCWLKSCQFIFDLIYGAHVSQDPFFISLSIGFPRDGNVYSSSGVICLASASACPKAKIRSKPIPPKSLKFTHVSVSKLKAM